MALVTGGARRVGRAIVVELARLGYDIALHFRSSHEQARRTAQDIRDLGRRCDLIQAELADHRSWPRIIDQAVAALGRLDILVNNASVFDPRPRIKHGKGADSFEVHEWDQLFRVNATAAAALCHFARPHLEASGKGRIINLVDVSAEKPWPGYISYCASKAALVAITRGLALAYAPKVTVNGIAPGIAIFPEAYPAELREKLISKVPLQRAGTPEDIARIVRYIVEDGAYVTGQILCVDGGRSVV